MARLATAPSVALRVRHDRPAHMLENADAATVRFSPAELEELSAAVRAIEVRGARLPEQVLVYSGVESALKK